MAVSSENQGQKAETPTREELIALCEAAIRPEKVWHDRDSERAQRQIGEAWALLKADCAFVVLDGEGPNADRYTVSNDRTIWVEVTSRGFNAFEMGRGYEEVETFYIPTQARLDHAGDRDWY